MRKNKGITLIALIVTIVILIILATISVNLILGDGGLVSRTQLAKDATDKETAREEVINAYHASKISKTIDNGVMVSKEMKQELQQYDIDVEVMGEEVIEVNYKGYHFTIDNKGNITISKNEDQKKQTKQVKDKKPGDITTDSKGNKLDGTPEKPYQINCIEDLIAFGDNVEAGFSNYSIELMTTLNFLSNKSYEKSDRTTLETVLIDGNTVQHSYENGLFSKMTQGEGFIPMGAVNGKVFSGIFEGKGNWIKNLYINQEKSDEHVYMGFLAINMGTVNELKISGTMCAKLINSFDANNVEGWGSLTKEERNEIVNNNIKYIFGGAVCALNNR